MMAIDDVVLMLINVVESLKSVSLYYYIWLYYALTHANKWQTRKENNYTNYTSARHNFTLWCYR